MHAAAVEHSMLSQFLPVEHKNSGFLSNPLTERAPIEYRVLILEKNVALAKLLATGLSSEAFSVDVADSLESATRRIENRLYQLVILDMDLSEGDGVNFLRSLRARRPEVRVLALGGQSGIAGLVSALDHGADDYLFKPFSLIEFMARARALRRRANETVQPVPRATQLVLRRDQCQVERDGRNIDLTPREFALLEVLMENAGKTLSRAMLTQRVWNMAADANTNIVDVYIKYLRDKIDGDHEEKLIRTVRGMGYSLQVPSANPLQAVA
jgi:two-component system copper resistance phosphate regulon response regulator CusR